MSEIKMSARLCSLWRIQGRIFFNFFNPPFLFHLLMAFLDLWLYHSSLCHCNHTVFCIFLFFLFHVQTLVIGFSGHLDNPEWPPFKIFNYVYKDVVFPDTVTDTDICFGRLPPHHHFPTLLSSFIILLSWPPPYAPSFFVFDETI